MIFLDVEDNASGDRFNRLVKNKPTFVLFFSPQCGHCKELEPEWNAMKEKLKTQYEGDMLLASIRHDMMDKVKCDKEIEGFPSMFVLENGKKKKEYIGERKKKNLLKFIEDNFSVSKHSQKNATISEGDSIQDRIAAPAAGGRRRMRRKRHKRRTKSSHRRRYGRQRRKKKRRGTCKSRRLTKKNKGKYRRTFRKRRR